MGRSVFGPGFDSRRLHLFARKTAALQRRVAVFRYSQGAGHRRSCTAQGLRTGTIDLRRTATGPLCHSPGAAAAADDARAKHVSVLGRSSTARVGSGLALHSDAGDPLRPRLVATAFLGRRQRVRGNRLSRDAILLCYVAPEATEAAVVLTSRRRCAAGVAGRRRGRRREPATRSVPPPSERRDVHASVAIAAASVDPPRSTSRTARGKSATLRPQREGMEEAPHGARCSMMRTRSACGCPVGQRGAARLPAARPPHRRSRSALAPGAKSPPLAAHRGETVRDRCRDFQRLRRVTFATLAPRMVDDRDLLAKIRGRRSVIARGGDRCADGTPGAGASNGIIDHTGACVARCGLEGSRHGRRRRRVVARAATRRPRQ